MKRLIALAGRAGSGKNTVATMLGAYEVAFADPLKRFCQEVFDFSDAQVWGPSEERNRPDTRYPRSVQCPRCYASGHDLNGVACSRCEGRGMLATHLTPRYALQTLGTEWGRRCYANVWADLGIRRALASSAEIVAITDCRFVNEARAVRAAGGEVWSIVRPGAGLDGAAGLHPSEAEQESPAFMELVTTTIVNVGTLEELATVVGSVLRRLR